MNCKVIFILLLIATLLRYFILWGYSILLRQKKKELYIDIASLLVPVPSSVEANESFRKTMTYIEKNPTDSTKFLDYIQNKFFLTKCPFKDPSTWGNNLTAGTDFRVFTVSNEDEKKYTSLK